MNLIVKNLSLSFDGQPVLRGLDMEIEDHQVLAIVGPSGGGKSTLLRILAGLQLPDEGSIIWQGKPLSFEEKDLLRHRRSVGTVFQSYNLFPHLTARQNIVLPLTQVHGLSRTEADERAWEYLSRFQVSEHGHKYPHQLSGGQNQRVAIARAMAFQPRLLFLDEPTSALDPEMTYEVLEAIQEIKREGRDLILVTHEIGFAREVADEMVFLADGRLLEQGSARSVTDHPRNDLAQAFFRRVLRW